MMHFAPKALVGALAAMAFAGVAHAGVNVVHPVGAVGSSEYPGYPAADAIDNAPNTDWASLGQGNNASLILDLGSVMDVVGANVTDRVTSGGGNGGFVGGTTDFTTEFSLTPCGDATCSVLTGPAQDFFHTVPVNPTSAADFEITVPLTSFDSRYVEYNVLQNVPSATNNTGLSDISFAVSAPEPASWAVLMLGVLAVGASFRMQRRAVAAA